MSKNILKAMSFAFCLALGGCIGRATLDFPQPDGNGEFPIVGEYVSAGLSLSIGGLSFEYALTRTEDPGDDEEATDAENRVDGFWVFQFDASSGAIVNGSPKYLTATGPTGIKSVIADGVLTTNNGNPSVVYVVANVGSDTWLSASSYDTLDHLLAAEIPNPDPIFTDSGGDPLSAIPMSGRTEGTVVVSGSAEITVPIYRMFAKIKADLSASLQNVNNYRFHSTYYFDTSWVLYNIPYVCRVGTLYNGGSSAADYSGVEFRSYDIRSISQTFSDTNEFGNFPDEIVVYVPENIQGEVAGATSDSRAEMAPGNATNVYVSFSFSGDDMIDNYYYGYEVVDPLECEFSVYPGGNGTDNYNIRRNCVYRIDASITLLINAYFVKYY